MGRVDDITKVIDAALDAISKDPNGLCLTYGCHVTPPNQLEHDGYPIKYKIKLGKRETKYNYILAVPKHAIATPNFSIIVEDADYPGGLRWQHHWPSCDYRPASLMNENELNYIIGALSYHIEQAIIDLITITLTNKEPNQ